MVQGWALCPLGEREARSMSRRSDGSGVIALLLLRGRDLSVSRGATPDCCNTTAPHCVLPGWTDRSRLQVKGDRTPSGASLDGPALDRIMVCSRPVKAVGHEFERSINALDVEMIDRPGTTTDVG